MSPTERQARRILGLVPVKPANIDLFTSDYLPYPVYPEAYPDGPPMMPATGVTWTTAEIRADLEAFLSASHDLNVQKVEETLALFDDEQVVARVPDPNLRAAFVILNITIAASAIEAVLSSGVYGETLSWDETGRAFTETSTTDADGKRYISMSEHYRHEHFSQVAPNLVHALLHHDEQFSYPEDAVNLTIASVVYLQLAVLQPGIVYQGTELCRLNNTFAMALTQLPSTRIS